MIKTSKENSPIMIVWETFSPYHVARVNKATRVFSANHLKLISVELYSRDENYLWGNQSSSLEIEKITLFPNTCVGEVPRWELFKGIMGFLEKERPLAIAISGYSTFEALVILFWCVLSRRYPILMSESKANDYPRSPRKELVKKLLIRQYKAALCGGTSHIEYLVNLGMPRSRIKDGYDAVDNVFFQENSDNVRCSQEKVSHLPGLDPLKPYFLSSGRFIPRKNYVGLVQAYNIYFSLCRENGIPPFHLIMLGDGPQKDEITQKISFYNLQNFITLAGIHSYYNLPVYYGMAKAFIHPALQDQWGLVVNEAMASSLPIIVSRNSGCASDLISNGVEGFIIDPTNLDQIGSIMFAVAHGGINRQEMGLAARRKISSWGVNRFATNFHNLVVELVNK